MAYDTTVIQPQLVRISRQLWRVIDETGQLQTVRGWDAASALYTAALQRELRARFAQHRCECCHLAIIDAHEYVCARCKASMQRQHAHGCEFVRFGGMHSCSCSQ